MDFSGWLCFRQLLALWFSGQTGVYASTYEAGNDDRHTQSAGFSSCCRLWRTIWCFSRRSSRMAPLARVTRGWGQAQMCRWASDGNTQSGLIDYCWSKFNFFALLGLHLVNVCSIWTETLDFLRCHAELPFTKKSHLKNWKDWTEKTLTLTFIILKSMQGAGLGQRNGNGWFQSYWSWSVGRYLNEEDFEEAFGISSFAFKLLKPQDQKKLVRSHGMVSTKSNCIQTETTCGFTAWKNCDNEASWHSKLKWAKTAL